MSIFVAMVVLAMTAINLSLSRSVTIARRHTWLRHLKYKQDLEDVSAILYDLLPPYYVELLIKSSGIGSFMPALPCRVVGLQVDISGLTQLSRKRDLVYGKRDLVYGKRDLLILAYLPAGGHRWLHAAVADRERAGAGHHRQLSLLPIRPRRVGARPVQD